MSAVVQVRGSTELEELARRAGEVNRRQAGSAEIVAGTGEFIDELARRFGSAGAPAPADPHDEILFYKALTDAQLALRLGDRRGLRVGLQRVLDALGQIIGN